VLEGWGADNTVALLGLVGAAVAFFVGLIQYRRAQQWKRAEWVAQEVKAVLADPSVDAALKMIDWGGRSIQLYPTRKNEDERFEWVASEEVVRGLASHHDHGPFTPKEAAIRDAFAHLLDGLERLEGYLGAGLITVSDLAPYLHYWAEHLENARGNPRLNQVRAYMSTYRCDGAARLLRRLNENLPRSESTSGLPTQGELESI